MGRRHRQDSPGAWHHVMNRGIARRPIFEDRACMRYFLSRLAYCVRAGDLEVHAYALMTTHYHLLVRSPEGHLSEAMRFAQNLYVRWFNRRHHRDGPLFRGRFVSRRVATLDYRRNIVRYIDQNPLGARVAVSPQDYSHGSARHYARKSGPPWLDRSWVEADAVLQSGAPEYSPLAYRKAFGVPLEEHEADLMKARIDHPSDGPDPLDDLVHSAPGVVLRWMHEKARLADGTAPGLPCASARRVQHVVGEAMAASGEKIKPGTNKLTKSGDVLLVALLRDLSGLRWSEIAERADASASTAKRRYQVHQEWLEMDAAYGAWAGTAARECFRAPLRGA